MKNVHTAPSQLFSALGNGSFFTEPYEAGWADEALAFVCVHEIREGVWLELQAQVSVDGVRWVDHRSPSLRLDAPGNQYTDISAFGNWLRLRGEVAGGPASEDPAVVLDIYWVLKG